MTPRNLVLVALPLLATCNEGAQAPSPTIATRQALGKVPSSEVATWQKVGGSSNPDGRFLQAVAWDEKRGVVVMFGGEMIAMDSDTPVCSQELWEWSPATGQWTPRTGTGTAPSARAGAAMVYDSTENLLVLFGGRTSDGVDYADTWEWDPTSGAWTDRTGTGPHPSARGQHGMVYEKSAGKILLFGGGTGTVTSAASSSTAAGAGVSASLKDTWEYDPVAHSWTARSPATGPSARHDFGLVWDADRKKALLVGGLQIDTAGAVPVPKQDTWEWDPAGTWTDRTLAGAKPSPRYGHALAYDGTRKKMVLFGGWNIDTSGSKNDLWDWDPTGAAWTQRLSGNEPGLPGGRIYASLVSDNSKGRLELLAGAVVSNSFGLPIISGYYASGSNEVWELDPATPTFTDRTSPQDLPSARSGHATVYNPTTRKVYLYGGHDSMGVGRPMDDLWEWDGSTWTRVVTDKGPPGLYGAGLAYDPARKSLILYGGQTASAWSPQSDTWEWNSTTRQWTKLSPADNPGPAASPGMVTDTTRNKILLFGSTNHVWEWDGSTLTWADRTPLSLVLSPTADSNPVMAYDEGRQKLLLYQGFDKGSSIAASASAFWEWDPTTAGWMMRDPGDALDSGSAVRATYDSIRRRLILYTDAPESGYSDIWELEAKTPQWYVRTMTSPPPPRADTAIAFDSGRGVAVMFGGMLAGNLNGLGVINDTWEYQVTHLGNGEGCTGAFATSCASGNCVDGVCCDSAACTGACKSCNVAGSEGTCKLVQAGTEVPGSCEDGKACDGTGDCKSQNGQSCSGSATCASGFCVSGICCDSACTGTCISCNLGGHAGKCTPQPAGTDPKNECTVGTGLCKSTCDGVGACGFPGEATVCDACNTCNGRGTCSTPTGECSGSGGAGGTTTPGNGGSGGTSSGSAGSGAMGGRTTGGGGMGGSATGGSATGGRATGGSSTSGVGGSATGGSGGSGSGNGGTLGRGGSGGSSTGSSGSAGQGGNDAGGTSAPHSGTGGSPPSGSGGSVGSTASRNDGSATDGGPVANLHRSGCSCAVGQAQASLPGWFPPFACAALFAKWLRRRRR